MARIFISYSRDDHATVSRLADALQEEGHEPWIDLQGIQAGDSWRRRIVEAIELSDALIVVLSASSATSRQVAAEVHLAAERNVPLFPVRLDQAGLSAEIRYDIAGLQIIDLGAGWDAALPALLHALAGGPTPSGDAATVPSAPRRRFPRAPALAIAAGAAALVIVAVLVLWPGSDDSADAVFRPLAGQPPAADPLAVFEESDQMICNGARVVLSAGPITRDQDLYSIPVAVTNEAAEPLKIFDVGLEDDLRVPWYSIAAPDLMDVALQAGRMLDQEVIFNTATEEHPGASRVVLSLNTHCSEDLRVEFDLP